MLGLPRGERIRGRWRIGIDAAGEVLDGNRVDIPSCAGGPIRTSHSALNVQVVDAPGASSPGGSVTINPKVNGAGEIGTRQCQRVIAKRGEMSSLGAAVIDSGGEGRRLTDLNVECMDARAGSLIVEA